MLSEAEIIHQLQTVFPSHIGDDAAMITPPAGKKLLLTKDILVENKHFRVNTTDAASLAHKSLHVNLSDLAAMGARPLYVLCGIAIPTRLSDYIKVFLNELTEACLAANIILIGGDTTASDHDLFISITAIGEANPHFIKHRHGAKPGNIICATGPLGRAHLGWIALENNVPNFYIEKQLFLKPSAKINEGLWLAQQQAVTAMMDISDGLYIDLKRLCAASQVQGVLTQETLPLTPEFNTQCETLQLNPLNTLLCGGEDYGLLFTVEADQLDILKKEYHNTFHEPLLQLGYITEGEDIRLTHQNTEQTFSLTPFTHFGESL